eukprot:g9735.t1
MKKPPHHSVDVGSGSPRINTKREGSESRKITKREPSETSPLIAKEQDELDTERIVGPPSFATMFSYAALCVVLAAVNSITWKRTLNRFRPIEEGVGSNLEFFVNQFSNLAYLSLAGLVFLFRLRNGKVSQLQRTFPWWKFALMGFLDSFSSLFSAVGGASTDGQVQTLLNQAGIPMTMLLSYYLLSSTYTRGQHVGAGLIVLGAMLGAIPSGGAGSQATPSSTPIGTFIFALSLLPNALSNVYKEGNFKDTTLDVYYMTTSITIFQTIFGFLSLPLLALPGFGGVPLSDVGDQFALGWRCFTGRPVQGFHCVGSGVTITFISYISVNFVYNVLIMAMTQKFTAMVVLIVSCLSMPVTNIAFTFQWVMGDEAEALTIGLVTGLVVVIVGFLLYSLNPDESAGDIMPIQGVAGQMMYVREPLSPLTRRNSINFPFVPAEPKKRLTPRPYSPRQTPPLDLRHKFSPRTSTPPIQIKNPKGSRQHTGDSPLGRQHKTHEEVLEDMGEGPHSF